MRKATKIWLITAAALVVLGAVLFTAVMTKYQWNFTMLSTVQYESRTFAVNEKFSGISVTTDAEDIAFVPSPDGTCKVACMEDGSLTHTVSVQDGKLIIKTVDNRKWYEHIVLSAGSLKLTVYLPCGEYGALSIQSGAGDVEIPKDFAFERMDISGSSGNVTNHASVSQAMKITTGSGDIRVEQVHAHSMDLSLSTGDATVASVTCAGDIKINSSTGDTDITNTQCKNVISDANTGDISLNNILATEKFSIERSSGDVIFDDCDAGEIFVKTGTGDVTGSLLSEKVFLAESSTGDIRVPKSITGGTCEITTSSGDIDIEIN